MKEEQEITEFEIKNESTWLSAIEWGVIYSLSIIVLEYFIVRDFSESAAATFYSTIVFASIVVLILAVKEVRDKKQAGSIGFWKGFFLCLLTGVVIASIMSFWAYLMYPDDPYYSREELVWLEFIGQFAYYAGFSLILGIAMKRN